MTNLSDYIERHIKKMLEEHSLNFVNVQRNELAEMFKCVPSQINYVLSTRFTIDQGFVVESRRGGGGYIKIIKIPFGQGTKEIQAILHLIGDHISQLRAERILTRMNDEGLLSKNELNLIVAAINRDNFPLADPIRDRIRALILKSMLKAALRKD